MQRTWIVMFALTLCLAALQSSSASEGQRFLERYGWWDGSWDFEAQEGDEVTQGEFIVSRRAGDSHFVGGTFGTGLWGYDPQLKRWVGFNFAIDGSLSRTILTSSDEEKLGSGVKETAHIETWQVDGTKVLSEETWTYLDDNTVTVRSVRKLESGERLNDIEYTNRRRPPGPHRAMLDAFARDQVGTWTSEEVAETDQGPLKKGDKYQAQFAFTWSPDKEALHLRYVAEFDGIQFNRTHGITGWDAAKNAIVVRWFNDQGATGVFIYTPNGTDWSFDFEWFDANGVRSVSKGTITVSGDTQRISTTSRKTGDEDLGETESTFTRKR